MLEISTSSLETAHSIRNNIDDFLKKDLFPQLELLFNEYPFNDEIIRFDELALDLSVEKWNDFKGFQFQIIDQLKGKIQKRITAYAKNAGDSIFGAESELKQFQRISGLTNSGRIFLYFLEFGNLPWYGK